MKKIFTLLIFVTFLPLLYGQVETKHFPKGEGFSQVGFIEKHLKANKIIHLPSFNVQEFIDEDNLNEGKDIPFRFGKGFDVNITLDSGAWTYVENGRLWSMEFHSEGAYSINFVFDQFSLPDGAELYIIDAEGTMLFGPVSSKQNTKNGYFLTDLVNGSDVTIYLFEPTAQEGKSQLTIKKVVHAYKNLFSNKIDVNAKSSGNCNNDINCFPAWDLESDAVAMVLLSSGTALCSGSLIMTADNSFRAYFLSAFHCIDLNQNNVLSDAEISDSESWMFKFQYKMTSCGGSTAATAITYNAAEFRAAWNTSDFALMEMNNSPIGDTRFSWLGWDRSGTSSTSSTGIHHPSGDVMKISFDFNSALETSYLSTSGTTHWMVDWDDGVTEGGSSGSPLFDQNKRVIGQLHGGYSACSNNDLRDWYGCFDHSWTGGGTNATRLSNWLDPSGTGAITTNTLRTPYISGPSQVCSSGVTFTISPTISFDSIQWNVGTNLFITSGQGTTSCTISSTGYGTTYVSVTIYDNGHSVTLPQKTVYAALAVPPLYDISGSATIVRNSTEHYSVSLLPSQISTYAIFNYDWSITSRLQFQSSHSYQTDVYVKGITIGSGKISFYTTNGCGTSTFDLPVRVVSGGMLSIYPNPANSEISIEIENNTKVDDTLNDISLSEQSTDAEYLVAIYDISGVPVYTEMFSNTGIKINTSRLQKGIYYVTLMKGNEKYVGSFIIE